ncbi:hypothetical protein [Clostridium estertheticum]|uniref:hypothetical protein n=1 Tax=Clostridium estertheticum TaxID=238834 RepID=UPI001CF46ACA|nr:hypothetical protein [Clostridium estertheticum]MCB2360943.1 hypothetical protein [Clostridium estertheticum]
MYFYIKYFKKVLRDYINEQKFKSPTEVLTAMKSMFKEHDFYKSIEEGNIGASCYTILTLV